MQRRYASPLCFPRVATLSLAMMREARSIIHNFNQTAMKKVYSLILFIFISTVAAAQAPDSLLKPSPVKTISNTQYDALMRGVDQYGMSLVADLNSYPSAQKVLKYKRSWT
jgi:mannose/fructose/N-acetylgalactosamine-specific phosphotransferase system component IIC